MYFLKTNSSFDSAHFLYGYDGKCRNIHGHRWTVEIEVQSTKLKENGQLRGMCVDFSTLKDDLRAETESFDHALIVEEGSMKKETISMLKEETFNVLTVDFRPTAENFAKYFYDRMKSKGYDVFSATVYETPNNCASYRE